MISSHLFLRAHIDDSSTLIIGYKHMTLQPEKTILHFFYIWLNPSRINAPTSAISFDKSFIHIRRCILNKSWNTSTLSVTITSSSNTDRRNMSSFEIACATSSVTSSSTIPKAPAASNAFASSLDVAHLQHPYPESGNRRS